MYSIEYSREAFKSLKAMPRNLATTVRVGNWRVIYEIHDDRLVVMILAVAPRGGAYQ